MTKGLKVLGLAALMAGAFTVLPGCAGETKPAVKKADTKKDDAKKTDGDEKKADGDEKKEEEKK